MPFSGKLEAELVDMPADERAAMAKDKGMESALPKIIKTVRPLHTRALTTVCALLTRARQGFTTIHLIYFFTAGEDEVKCWTLRKGMKAPQAAGTIHTARPMRFGTWRSPHPRRPLSRTSRRGLCARR